MRCGSRTVNAMSYLPDDQKQPQFRIERLMQGAVILGLGILVVLAAMPR